MTKVTIDKGCIECEACAAVCPEVFYMSYEECSAINILGDVPDELLDSVKEAADSCPMGIIEIG